MVSDSFLEGVLVIPVSVDGWNEIENINRLRNARKSKKKYHFPKFSYIFRMCPKKGTDRLVTKVHVASPPFTDLGFENGRNRLYFVST